jgi:hypothetical protein
MGAYQQPGYYGQMYGGQIPSMPPPPPHIDYYGNPIMAGYGTYGQPQGIIPPAPMGYGMMPPGLFGMPGA